MKFTKSRFMKLGFLLATSCLLSVSFQNCSATSFQAKESSKIIDAACNVPEGCQSAASDTKAPTLSEGNASQSSTSAANSNSNANYNNSSNTSPASTTPANQASDSGQQSSDSSEVAPIPPIRDPLYNFVAGEKATCEASIFSTFGKYGTCSIGGGCGLSCGNPGGSCVSANPYAWGACLTKNDSSLRAPAAAPKLYNIVAGDKGTCESSAAGALGYAVSCSIGGGCGLSCGAPSASCQSANPSYWGACVSK